MDLGHRRAGPHVEHPRRHRRADREKDSRRDEARKSPPKARFELGFWGVLALDDDRGQREGADVLDELVELRGVEQLGVLWADLGIRLRCRRRGMRPVRIGPVVLRGFALGLGYGGICFACRLCFCLGLGLRIA